MLRRLAFKKETSLLPRRNLESVKNHSNSETSETVLKVLACVSFGAWLWLLSKRTALAPLRHPTHFTGASRARLPASRMFAAGVRAARMSSPLSATLS
eukprot:scaffold368_cov258-Pinguiococcus_pyrenoidosus.AAC.71